MRKNLFVAYALLAFAVSYFNSSIAQTGTTKTPEATSQSTKTDSKTNKGKQKSPEQIAKKQANEMKTKLDLNANQSKQIEGIYLTNLNDKDKNPDGSKKIMRQQTHDEVNKVLTPDQQKKWKDLKDQKRKEKNEKMKSDQK